MPLEKCNLCGLCKADCPVFKAILKETVGPRGKAILIKKDILDKVFYICTLCGACTRSCPFKVDLKEDILKRRELLVEKGVETMNNREIVEEIKRKGHLFD